MAHLTKTDILNTAFRVWGREFYKNTSLAQIARTLGVTKAALYRHFRNKQALVDAMYERFFDEYAAFIKGGYEQALEAGSGKKDGIESQFIMMRAIVEYYVRNRDSFLFSLIMVYDAGNTKRLLEYLKSQGMDMKKLELSSEPEDSYPSIFQVAAVSLIFWMSHFHRYAYAPKEAPSDEQVRRFVLWIEDRIKRGLGFDPERLDRIDFEGLEAVLAREVPDPPGDRGILKAVAEAVAETGPWNTSMDMVARRSGLSKSGLYAHFKNKQDMMARLFNTEFNRIIAYARRLIRKSAVPEEQVYLGMIAITEYFRSRPEILIAVDWIRTRRLDIGDAVTPQLFRVFSDIAVSSTPTDRETEFLKEQVSQWILFLVTNILMYRPSDLSISELFNHSTRKLYRFIAAGIGGGERGGRGEGR